MGDLSDAIAHQLFHSSDPYPDGVYTCDLDYTFPSLAVAKFAIRLTRVEALDWVMKFADVADGLEALWFAFVWFDEEPEMVPNMDVEIRRSRRGSPGPTFLGSKGSMAFSQIRGTSNISVS